MKFEPQDRVIFRWGPGWLEGYIHHRWENVYYIYCTSDEKTYKIEPENIKIDR